MEPIYSDEQEAIHARAVRIENHLGHGVCGCCGCKVEGDGQVNDYRYDAQCACDTGDCESCYARERPGILMEPATWLDGQAPVAADRIRTIPEGVPVTMAELVAGGAR